MSETEHTHEAQQSQKADQQPVAASETVQQPPAADLTETEVQQPPAVVATDDVDVALVPSTRSGMPPTAQTFFAVVNANGTLARGFGVVSSTRLVAGQYQVVFSHDVRGSAYVGTIGLSGNVGGSPPGEIAVVGRAGVPNGVFVQTFASNGIAADRGFHLAVLS